MKRKILVLCFCLVLCSACRTKHQEHHSQRRDSLSLWQWEEIVIKHERLDSTGERATERTVLVGHRAKVIAKSSSSDSSVRQQVGAKQKSKERKTSSLDFLLVGLVVGFAIALYLALRYRSVLSGSQSKSTIGIPTS